STSSSKVLSGTEYRRSTGLFGSLTRTYLPSSILRHMSTMVRTIPHPLLRLRAIWLAKSRGLLVRTPRMTWSLLFLGFVRETKLEGLAFVVFERGLVDSPKLHGVCLGQDALHCPPSQL